MKTISLLWRVSITAFIVGGILLSTISLVKAGEVEQAIGRAVSYLKTQPVSPDVTLALVAARESVDVSYLKNFSGTTAISYAKPILALAGAQENPRTFPNEDFVQKLESFFDGTQIGDANAINDDIWGILALSAGGSSSRGFLIQKSKEFILANQNDDGGFPWNRGGASGTDNTAAAVMALLEGGVPKSDSAIQNAIAYIKSNQNSDGGFSEHPGGPSNSNTDALVISMIYRLGEDPRSWVKDGKHPIDHLLSLQTEEGFFVWREGDTNPGFQSTEQAVVALSQKFYPVQKILPPEVAFQIRGIQVSCEGMVRAATALDVVLNASEQCGNYTAEIQYFGGLGLFLNSIDGDIGGQPHWWGYLVDWEVPDIGAGSYTLSGNETVLWVYGKNPLRIKLAADQTVYSPGETLEGSVEAFDFAQFQWNPVQGAQVFFNGKATDTNEAGAFEIQLTQIGMFEIQAKKEGFADSNIISIVVGEVSDAVDLSVEVVEQIPGGLPEVGFSVTPSSLSFGKLEPGKTATGQVTLINEGQKNLEIRADVEGDPVFNFLKIANVIWSAFEKLLQGGQEETVEVSLSLPVQFSSFGAKQGMLIFWGKAAQSE